MSFEIIPVTVSSSLSKSSLLRTSRRPGLIRCSFRQERICHERFYPGFQHRFVGRLLYFLNDFLFKIDMLTCRSVQALRFSNFATDSSILYIYIFERFLSIRSSLALVRFVFFSLSVFLFLFSCRPFCRKSSLL